MAALGIALALPSPSPSSAASAPSSSTSCAAARGTQGGVTSRTLLRAYLRFAYLVSLVVFLVGAVNVLTAGFATAFGHGFSYTQQSYPCPACINPTGLPGTVSPVPCPAPKDNRQADDLIRGVSLLVAGLILGAGHRAGQIALESTAERRESALARAEGLLGTTGFGVVAIITIPWAVYVALRYVVLGTGSDLSSTPEPPGGALASAIAFTPAWAYYLAIFVSRARRTSSAETV